MADADDVRRLALALPHVEEIDCDGFDFRVAGKGFVWSYPERQPGQGRVLNPGGVYLTTAPSPAIFVQMPWTARFGSRRAVVAFTGLRAAAEKRRDLLVIKELAEASALTAVVGAEYPLARIADAHRRVDAGHKKGSVVVTMS